MAEETRPASKESEYKAPQGTSSEQSAQIGGSKLDYTASADWIVLRKKEKPVAEMFHVAYLAKNGDPEDRPVTFVFNGGPGAASAYLHMGALGPQRVAFADDGTILPPPARNVDNEESWLAFTDLVFIDPIGTGFSRAIDEKKDKEEKAKKEPAKEFWGLNRDLESLGEFVQRFLSKHKRWTSPVFIAGESYGGFRVAKLIRLLQQGYGVGLSGAILISPALEWYLLSGSDYDALSWAGAVPTMAAAARHHGISTLNSDGPLDQVLREVEVFTAEELIPMLVQGDAMPEEKRSATMKKLAGYIGLPEEFLAVRGGRIDILTFSRELLRTKRQFVGLYDAAISAIDPFPDRTNFEGPDPTLSAIERVFTGGINSQLRHTLDLDTERDYLLLNMEVNTSWKVDAERHAFDGQVGSTDDLRYGMALNPHLKVFITHGYYDLVTPYWASSRIAGLLKLEPSQKENLTVQHYPGGHMFYTWKDSRVAFRDDIASFVNNALG